MRSLFHRRAPKPPPVELVPTVFPRIAGADIAASFAARRVAGDFYDSVRVGPERVLFGLLDLAGRREDNRSLLVAAQEIFRNYGAELFSRPDLNESDAMTELGLHINRHLIEVSSGVHSCPAFIACYHERFGTLCYTNAGHTPGLLRDNTGITELGSTGLPLGLFSHATADAPTVGLAKGAVLLLVSRGLVECEGHKLWSDEEFGLERVKQFLLAAPPSSAQTLCVSILDAVGKFTGATPLRDDRTALAFVRAS
ncbi:Serine phosphatase [Candidatus Sulfotelmatobacter kueseliae]|uniref:Serine phosphatase n=1 Tax=Candidatus Sulfotelmatobacter kueseliae TaxID=2042962 RepID=A0A2U3K646_9BACT|nr:Serine phosphatase [Candidatus Sulfotelmatobacter kueseliae]